MRIRVKKLWRFIFWNLIVPTQAYSERILLFLLVKSPIHIPSTFFGPPKGIYPFTIDWIGTKKENDYFKYQEIESKYLIHKKSPKCLEKEIHWEFTKWQIRESPALFLLELNNGRVVGEGRGVITPDDYILGDVSPEYRSNPYEHSLLSHLKLPALDKTDETIAIIANVGGANYYHWLFDVLPRFHVLERARFDFSQIDRFLLNKISHSFQLETLTALGIKKSQIIEADESLHLQAKRLIVPSLAGEIAHPSKWICQFLRNCFLSSNEDIEAYNYLYISRGKAARRRVLNEAEVCQILVEVGFKVVDFEDFSFSEQVKLISSASVVVAPHGAALANLVFCRPYTKVIEFFAPKYVNQCYLALADQVNLDYYYLIGNGELLQKGTFNPEHVKDDIVVNIETMLNLLKMAGIEI